MTDNGSAAPRIASPEEIAPAAETARRLLEALDGVLLGQHELHRLVVVGILSRGHLLLEGMPGLGKTVLIRTLASLLRLDFKRIQFTPDLMPSDILGSSVLQQSEDGRRSLEFREGPVFTNILLADEINRASPKTQSALLEAMQEGRATIMGESRALPSPFFVLASQNPIELDGTYALPEAQLDRFMFKLDVGMPEESVLEEIIGTRRRGDAPEPEPLVDHAGLLSLFEAVDSVALPRLVARFIAAVVHGTHPGAGEEIDTVERYVLHGASPRAAIAIAEAARAQALLNGRPTVGFEDVASVAPQILGHRVILNHEARFQRVTARTVVEDVLAARGPDKGGLPAGVEMAGSETT